MRSHHAFCFVAGYRNRLFRGLLRNRRSVMRSRHAFCFVAGYRYAWQEIIIQCIGRPRQYACLQHPGTAAGTDPVVQADAYDLSRYVAVSAADPLPRKPGINTLEVIPLALM